MLDLAMIFLLATSPATTANDIRQPDEAAYFLALGDFVEAHCENLSMSPDLRRSFRQLIPPPALYRQKLVEAKRVYVDHGFKDLPPEKLCDAINAEYGLDGTAIPGILHRNEP